MKTWRIYTPYFCRVVIESDPAVAHRMKQFDGMTEEEVIQIVIENILRKCPDAEIKRTTHWNRPAIDISRDGEYHYFEPEIEPPELYQVAQGY